MALGNMTTAAALTGIDFCPIEGFHIEETEALLSDKFGVDTAKYRVSFMAVFGYRKADPEFPKSRRNLKDTLTRKQLIKQLLSSKVLVLFRAQ